MYLFFRLFSNEYYFKKRGIFLPVWIKYPQTILFFPDTIAIGLNHKKTSARPTPHLCLTKKANKNILLMFNS